MPVDPKNWTTMTELDRRAARALSPTRVTYLPCTPWKRFAQQMAAASVDSAAMITDKQRRLLWSNIIRYRRQLRAEDQDLLEIARKLTEEPAH
jgi:hypothetical protein